MISPIETIDEFIVSSGRWGEDGDYGLADAVHFHVASSALKLLKIHSVFYNSSNQLY
jgi:hypothetical protein